MKKWIVGLILVIASSVGAYQASIDVPNGTGAQVRSNMNNALKAITTLQSGASAPSATYAYQLWVDTSTSPPTLKSRKGDNTAWITLGTINDSTGKFIADDSNKVGTFMASQAPGANQVVALNSNGALQMGSIEALRVLSNLLHTGFGYTTVSASNTDNYVTANAYFAGSGVWNYITGAAAARLDLNRAGTFYLYTAGVGSGGSPITWNGPYTIWHSGNDGPSSGLSAQYLNNQEGSYYTTATNITSGTLPDAQRPTGVPYARYESGLRIVRGVVTYSEALSKWAGPDSGSGFTVPSTPNGPTGTQINFTNAFTDLPACTVSNDVGSTNITSLSTSSIFLNQLTGSPVVQSKMSFICIGTN